MTEKELLESMYQFIQEMSGTVNGKIDSMGQKLEALDQKVDALDQRVGSLEQKVDSLDERLGRVEQLMLVLESRLSAVEADLRSLEEEVQALKVRVQMNGTELQLIRSRVQVMESRMENLERSVTSIQLTLENDTNMRINIVAEGHLDVMRKLNEAMKIDDQKEKMAIRVVAAEDEIRRLKASTAILEEWKTTMEEEPYLQAIRKAEEEKAKAAWG